MNWKFFVSIRVATCSPHPSVIPLIVKKNSCAKNFMERWNTSYQVAGLEMTFIVKCTCGEGRGGYVIWNLLSGSMPSHSFFQFAFAFFGCSNIIYFVNRNWVDTRWQQYSTHLHTDSTHNSTMKQNAQNINNNMNT